MVPTRMALINIISCFSNIISRGKGLFNPSCDSIPYHLPLSLPTTNFLLFIYCHKQLVGSTSTTSKTHIWSSTNGHYFKSQSLHPHHHLLSPHISLILRHLVSAGNMAESRQISEEMNENETESNAHKHHQHSESMDTDDGSTSMSHEEEYKTSLQMRKSKLKALIDLRRRVEEAVLGNYIVGKSESDGNETQENLHDISLWGVPLLPSKGHQGTDIILLKFLKARDFKVGEAFKMLRRTLLWRREFKTEGILEENFGPHLENVFYIKGADKEGHPLCYNVCGAFKDREFWKKTFGSEDKCEEFIRWRVQSMERVIQKLSFTAGGVDSMVQIMDLKNSPRPSTKELRLVTKKAVSVLQDNYPELIFRHVND